MRPFGTDDRLHPCSWKGKFESWEASSNKRFHAHGINSDQKIVHLDKNCFQESYRAFGTILAMIKVSTLLNQCISIQSKSPNSTKSLHSTNHKLFYVL